jgi:hypothetical protein
MFKDFRSNDIYQCFCLYIKKTKIKNGSTLYLVVGGSVLAQRDQALGGNGEEEPRDVDETRLSYKMQVLIQVLLLVVVGGGQVGNERAEYMYQMISILPSSNEPVLVYDQYSTGTSRSGRVLKVVNINSVLNGP